MVKRVVWSKNAVQDKILILDYWYKRIGTKAYSRKLGKSLRDAVKHLKKYPEMDRIKDDTGIRYIIKEHHLIFYKILQSEIQILHVWDSRRNPDDLNVD